MLKRSALRFDILTRFALAILCVLAASAFNGWTLRSLTDADERMAQTYQVLSSLDQLKTEILRVEANPQASLGPRQAWYQDSFAAQEQRAYAAMSRLKSETTGSLRQQRRLDEVDELLRAKFAYLRKDTPIKTPEYAIVTNRLVSQMEAMFAEEESHLTDNQAASERERVRQVWVSNGFRILAFVLFLSSYRSLRRVMQLREEAIQELQERTRELESAQRLAHVGHWRWDSVRDSATWSPELYRVTGRDPSLPPPGYAEHANLFSPESRERLQTLVNKALTDGAPYAYQLEMVREDGSRRWIAGEGEPEFGPDGRVIGIRGALQDVTQRKTVEAALRQKTLQLEEAQRQSRTGSWRVNLRTGETFWSEELYRIVDRPLSLPPLKFDEEGSPFAPDIWMKIRSLLVREAGEDEPFELEHELTRANGERFWVLSRADVSKAEDGKTTGLRGTIQNITERHEVEEALKQKSLELEASQRLAHVGSWSYHLSSGATAWSREMYNLFDLPPDSSIPEPGELRMFYTPETFLRIEAVVDQVVRNGTPTELEHEVIRAKGGRRWVASYCEPWRNAEGKVEGVRGSLVDVTERKAAADQLRRAKDMAEAASRSKAEFLASMSHEIRTPMNGVIGMTSLLMTTPLSGEQRSFVETIRASGESLMALINDILDFSRIEAGKLMLEDRPFNLPQMVEEAIDVVNEAAAEKKLKLRYDPGTQLAEVIRGDPFRLRQVLLNLLSNALKFTHDGMVTLTILQDKDSAGQEFLRFTVTDTGIGITEKQMANLFQDFTQAEVSTSRRYGGSGLGLTISRRLVSMMGGELKAESVTGQGSTFWFQLPVRSGPADDAESGLLNLNAALRKKRLLAISDDAFDLMQAERLGQMLELSVTTAGSGDSQSEGSSWDGVLIDCDMEAKDCFQLARLLRMQKGGGLPLLFWGTGRDPIVRAKVAELGEAAVYLMKPLLRKSLASALHDLSPNPPAPVMKRRPEFPPLRGEILVAEDNKTNQAVIRQMLKLLGCRSQIVPDGLQAVEAARSHAYDLVLMDCQMPEMDGWAATKMIRESGGSLAGMPIVALTASALLGDREKCLASGMNDCLTKPLELAKLHAALSQWLVKEQVNSPD